MRLKIWCGASAAALLLPAAAWAACPEGTADAAADIYAEFDGYMMRYDRRPDGVVEELERAFDGATGYRFLVHPGGIVLDSWQTDRGRLVPDSREQVDYAAQGTVLPEIEAGLTWTGTATLRLGDGAEVATTTAMIVGQPVRMSIGPCAYESWPVEIRTRDSGDAEDQVHRLRHLPQLGISLYLGGGPASETFTPDLPLSISTEPPAVRAGSAAPRPPPAPRPSK